MLHRKSTWLIIGALIALAGIYFRFSAEVRVLGLPDSPAVADLVGTSGQAPQGRGLKTLKHFGSDGDNQ